MKAQAKTARGHKMGMEGGEGGEGSHPQSKTGSAKVMKTAHDGDKCQEEMAYAGRVCQNKMMKGMS